MDHRMFAAREDIPHKLEEIVKFLTGMPAWYFATSVDGQPHVRPFSFAALDEQRLWFSTSVGKDVWNELQANPRFELSAWQPKSNWLIISGQVVFDEPPERIRLAGYHHMLGLGENHESAYDGRLCFFYIRQGVARICDIDGTEYRFELPEG